MPFRNVVKGIPVLGARLNEILSHLTFPTPKVLLNKVTFLATNQYSSNIYDTPDAVLSRLVLVC